MTYPLPVHCSYHQKYLLRQHQDIHRTLKLSDKELISSTAATRLNGYCGGYGKLYMSDH